MFKPGDEVRPVPERLRFSQTDPADLMSAYIPSNLSPGQQKQLDAFKFQTMRNDYEYFQEHPEISDIVGYILENVINVKPLDVKRYLSDLFEQPHIEEKINNYRDSKKCKGSPDIEEVVDHGYQIVEDHDIDPCGTPHVDHRVCDGKMMSQNRDIMKRMREIHEMRNNMIPTFNTNFKLASDETLETMLDGVTQMDDAGLLGAPQDLPLYGGDYIFLRNTRCGRQIAQYIGDTREIPTRPWDEPTHMESTTSCDHWDEGRVGRISQREAEEGKTARENSDTGSKGNPIMSRASSFMLRKFFEGDHKTAPFESESRVLGQFFGPGTFMEIHRASNPSSHSIELNETKYDMVDDYDNTSHHSVQKD